MICSFSCYCAHIACVSWISRRPRSTAHANYRHWPLRLVPHSIANFTNSVHTVGHNKTKLYRLHNPDLTGWQGGSQMMKNETDSVGMARESGGADSAANPPLQAKQSLARGDRVQ